MRRLLRALLVGPLALAAACGAAGDEPLPPNLLFVSIDTLRADAVGAYGRDWDGTKALDALAARGVTFTSAWAHSPKTAPSHMTMFTGLPPRTHGLGNQRSSGAQSLSDKVTTLAETLQRAGFHTGAVTSGGNVKGYLGFERGFDSFDERPSQPPQKLERMTAWIRDAATPAPGEAPRPWFAFFHTYAVHDPYLPPKKYVRKYTDPDYTGDIVGDPVELARQIRDGDDRAPWAETHAKAAENFWMRVDVDDPADMAYLEQLYLAGVAAFDFQLGRFLDELEAEGLLENTIVVVTSDHGEEFGEHGDTRHNSVWRQHLHVPLVVVVPPGLVRDPALVTGREIDAPVRHMDLMPSLLELLGVDPEGLVDQAMLGESWAPWLADPAAEDPGRPVYGEHRSRLETPLDLWALRQGDRLLIQPRPDGVPLLLDLATNALELRADGGLPGELGPDHPDHALLLDLQKQLLGRFQREAGEVGVGAGIELSPEARAELEALGYL